MSTDICEGERKYGVNHILTKLQGMPRLMGTFQHTQEHRHKEGAIDIYVYLLVQVTSHT